MSCTDTAQAIVELIKNLFDGIAVITSAISTTVQVAFSRGPIKVVQIENKDDQKNYSKKVQDLEKKLSIH